LADLLPASCWTAASDFWTCAAGLILSSMIDGPAASNFSFFSANVCAWRLQPAVNADG
jgi:hypothetical protein